MKNIVRTAIDIFLDIFFPKRCVGCGRYGDFLCLACAGEIEYIKTPLCPECGRITKFGEFCPACKQRTATALTGLIVAADFEKGPVREMIHELKYSGLIELAPLLGESITLRLKDRLPSGKLIVVPVPLHWRRERERGFNQAELLARYISKRLDLPGGLALAKAKNAKPQAQLKREQRLKNLAGIFSVIDAELVSGKTILLVDDVATTCSTLNECAKVLREAGAKQVWGVVIARG